jgi:hypothetical protein
VRWREGLTFKLHDALIRAAFRGIKQIGLLVAYDHSDDGYALLRGLMGDSQRLQVLARRPTSRAALALGWMEAAVRDLEDRSRTAKRFGQETFAAGIESIIGPQRIALDGVQRELGIRRRQRTPMDGRQLAIAAGHPDDELDWVIASDPTHGSLATSLLHDRRQGVDPRPGETAGVVIGGNDPGWRATVADRSTRHMVRATAAMAQVCELTNVAEIIAYGVEIERRLDAEEIPGSD